MKSIVMIGYIATTAYLKNILKVLFLIAEILLHWLLEVQGQGLFKGRKFAFQNLKFLFSTLVKRPNLG